MEQRLSLVTLGVADLDRSRRFYEDGLGWRPKLATPEVAFFQAGGAVVALYPVTALWADAGLPDGTAGPAAGAMALAHNVRSRAQVDAVLAEAARAGAAILRPARDTDWGGYVGYFADPDGHLWEVAWNPGFPLDVDGRIRLP